MNAKPTTPSTSSRPTPCSIKQGGLVGVHAGSNDGLITRAARLEQTPPPSVSVSPAARSELAESPVAPLAGEFWAWTSFAGRQWRARLFLRGMLEPGVDAARYIFGGVQVTDLGKGSSCTRSIIAGRQGQLVLLDFFLACAPPVEDKKGAAAPSGFADHSPTHCTLVY
jgi:hypothetical protein